MREPQSSLKFLEYPNLEFLEYSNLECLHLVIQVGLTDLDDSFKMPRAFVTWGSKPTSTLKQFLSHGEVLKISKIPYGLDIPPTRPWLIWAI